MTGIWSAIVVLVMATNAQRVAWVEPAPVAWVTAKRAVMAAEEFGPGSAYRQLLSLKDMPEAYDDVMEVERWLQDLDKTPLSDRRWDARTRKRIRCVLLNAGPELELVRRVANMPDARVPNYLRPGVPLDETISLVRGLRQVVVLSAYEKEGRGDYAGALADLTAYLRLIAMQTRGGTCIHQLNANPTAAISSQTIWRIASRNRIPANVLRKTADEILEVRSQWDSVSEAIRNELPFLLRWFDAYLDPAFTANVVGTSTAIRQVAERTGLICLAGGTLQGSKRNLVAITGRLAVLGDAPYSPATVKRLRAVLRPLQFETYNGPCYSAADPFGIDEAICRALGRPPTNRTQTPDWDMIKPYFVYRDPYGLAVASAQLRYFATNKRHHTETMAVLHGTALFLAIQAYEADHGRPPARLRALVPAYVRELPEDPFTGKSFRYVVGRTPHYWGKVKWGIYSVGANFRNDNGQATEVASIYQKAPTDRRNRWNPDIIWIPKPLP